MNEFTREQVRVRAPFDFPEIVVVCPLASGHGIAHFKRGRAAGVEHPVTGDKDLD